LDTCSDASLACPAGYVADGLCAGEATCCVVPDAGVDAAIDAPADAPPSADAPEG
jgi:hypothetical protein